MKRSVLKNSFYTILTLSPAGNKNVAPGSQIQDHIARVKLNEHHPVYEGHFPGNPVVPGVCQVQIIKEIVSEVLREEIVLVNSDNIKFLNIIVPEKHPVLEVKVCIKNKEDASWDVTGSISKEDMYFLKFKGIFQHE
jgi:3-hydroxyacyl-[acyl-carrier-protein] dehydratase